MIEEHWKSDGDSSDVLDRRAHFVRPCLAYIGIGSNLGNREANVKQALAMLNAMDGCQVLRQASLYRTKPVDCPPGSGEFINTVAELETHLDPESLMRRMLQVEQALGRLRTDEKNAPRTIDLDLLLHGETVASWDIVRVPHPHMAKRDFVLRPLSELVPELVHPILGHSIEQLLRMRIASADQPAVALTARL